MILRLLALIIPAAIVYSIGDLAFNTNPTPGEIVVVVVATAISLTAHDEGEEMAENKKVK